MAYDNELKFALFKNDKGDNQSRPDYRGTITVGGVEYTLSGWIAESKKDGSKYIRGQAQVAKPRGEQKQRRAPANQKPPPSAQKQASGNANDDSDNVPF